MPVRYEMVLRRIPVDTIPVEDENQCAEFVQELYREKVLKIFLRTYNI